MKNRFLILLSVIKQIILSLILIYFTTNVSAQKEKITVFMEKGGWCWFQDPRAIIVQDQLIIAGLQGTDGGDVKISIYDLKKKEKIGTAILHEKFQQDDHNVPALYLRPDKRLLAVYARHSRDTNHYYRISQTNDYLTWGPERSFPHENGVTYMNLYHLSLENRLYCFYRDSGTFNPFYFYSEDYGTTWMEGTHFIADGLKKRSRPYVRYTADNKDTICFSFTEAHPRKYGNSIYYATFQDGNFYSVDGTFIKSLQSGGPLLPQEADMVFQGDNTNRGWTSSIVIDTNNYPHIGYSVRKTDDDHRFRLAHWNGEKWIDCEVAFAGKCLYKRENDYTGLITIDPVDPYLIYISTDVDPATGKTTEEGKHEIYMARIKPEDNTDTIKWQPLTKNSTVRNIRPVCAAGNGYKVLLWLRGPWKRFKNYQSDIVGIIFQ